MGDDDVVLRIDGALDVVADDVGAVALRRHCPRIGVGHGDLVLAAGAHLFVQGGQRLQLLLQRCNAALQTPDLRGRNRDASDLMLSVGTVEFGEVSVDGVFDGCHSACQPDLREVLLSVVHRLKLSRRSS